MPNSALARISVCLSFALLVASTVKAQVPTRASEPRLAPAREPVLPAPGQPTVAPAAAAQPAPAAEPAPVSAAPAPSGVTQVPPAAAPPATASTSSAAVMKSSYSASRFSLSLDGMDAGYLQAVEGGAAVGTVVLDELGPDNIPKKHVANVKYEELTFDVTANSKPVVDWVSSSWQGKPSKKSGIVQVADHNFNVVAQREFRNALITGTTISGLDKMSGKKPLVLTVTLAPEFAREVPASGKVQGASVKSSKTVMSANFRFEMEGLETAYVTHIEPFTIRQKAAADASEETRSFKEQPGTIDFPNLKITMRASPTSSWSKWNEDFLIGGKGGDDQEKKGAIVFVDQTLQNEVGRIDLFNCGLVRFAPDRQEAGMEKLSTATAELYCERMALTMKS